ncbi:MAG: porin family protein [Bacteroidia bacterium]
MKILKTRLLGIISLAAFIFTGNVNAQADRQNNSRFGIKGGLNVSNLIANDVNNNSGKLGFNGGLFLRIALTENISFQPELLYSMKGSELQYHNDFVNGTARFSLNYIDIPILAVINLSRRVNVHGGLYVASLTNVHIKNEADIDAFDFEKELNKDDFEPIDYGLVIGLGGDFDKVSLGIRYEYGLKTVGKEQTFSGQSYRFPDARNSTFQFYLGISIL